MLCSLHNERCFLLCGAQSRYTKVLIAELSGVGWCMDEGT